MSRQSAGVAGDPGEVAGFLCRPLGFEFIVGLVDGPGERAMEVQVFGTFQVVVGSVNAGGLPESLA